MDEGTMWLFYIAVIGLYFAFLSVHLWVRRKLLLAGLSSVATLAIASIFCWAVSIPALV